MVHKRRRGTAIVETPRGILVVSGKRKLFLLPGGKANHRESRKGASIRELKEETGLITLDCKYLFSHMGGIHKDYSGGHFQDHHKVFLITTKGNPKPKHEIKHIAYYNPKSNIKISNKTKEIIEKYYSIKT